MSSKKKGKKKTRSREETEGGFEFERDIPAGEIDVMSDPELLVEDFDGADSATVYSKSFSYGINGNLIR